MQGWFDCQVGTFYVASPPYMSAHLGKGDLDLPASDKEGRDVRR